jgi:hypothetical protein
MEVGSNFLQQLRAGNLKAYAVAAKSRLAVAPNIPTVDEAGLPGFYRSVWVGLWMPKGASKEVIIKINAAVKRSWPSRICALGLQNLGRRFSHESSRRGIFGCIVVVVFVYPRSLRHQSPLRFYGGVFFDFTQLTSTRQQFPQLPPFYC